MNLIALKFYILKIDIRISSKHEKDRSCHRKEKLYNNKQR